MDKPLVTVVIPCHNYAQYVTDAIRSVQAQTLNNFECIVVNDSSTDDSAFVIAEAIKDDARFEQIIVNHASLSASRNVGIEQGSAPYLCCLDADDMMGSPEYLEVMVSALERDRTLGIAFSCIQVMDADGKLGHVPNWPNGFDAEGQYNHINQIPSLCVFSREMWRRAGGFRPYYRYVEDAEFWTTCIDIGYGAIHATTQPWFHYRLHNKSASQVHRTGEIPEPDWLEYHPWATDGQRPFAAGGRPPRGSWPVRFYDEPEVSIIIPVGKGHEELVKDALHSVEGQTFRMWECIVVNDTGYSFDPDGLPWAKIPGFPWAKVVRPMKGRGAGMARNFGAKYAKGDFVVFLDADDMMKPHFLERTLAAYKKHGRYAYTDWLTHDKMTNWQTHTTPEYSAEAMRQKSSIHPITCLIPRQWFKAVGGFDEGLTSFEDVDFFMKLLTHGYCGVRVPEPLLIYNLDSGFRRKQQDDKFRIDFAKLLKKRYGDYMEGNKMCDCVQPPKGKTPMAPTMENVEEYRETYGDMILARLVGKFTAEAPVEFRGPATRVMYGRRAKGDVFYIWQADLDNGGDMFERVEEYATEPEPTVVPPAPPEVSTPYEDDLKTLSPAQFKELHQNEWSEPPNGEPMERLDMEPEQTMTEAVYKAPEPKAPPPKVVANNPKKPGKSAAALARAIASKAKGTSKK